MDYKDHLRGEKKDKVYQEEHLKSGFLINLFFLIVDAVTSIPPPPMIYVHAYAVAKIWEQEFSFRVQVIQSWPWGQEEKLPILVRVL